MQAYQDIMQAYLEIIQAYQETQRTIISGCVSCYVDTVPIRYENEQRNWICTGSISIYSSLHSSFTSGGLHLATNIVPKVSHICAAKLIRFCRRCSVIKELILHPIKQSMDRVKYIWLYLFEGLKCLLNVKFSSDPDISTRLLTEYID